MKRGSRGSWIATTCDRRSRDDKARAFTLVEVLLSLALVAGLMTAMSQLVFSLGEVWTKNQAQFVFLRHTRAVTRHVGDLLAASAVAENASASSCGGPSVREVELPGGAEGLLRFELPAGDRLLAWTGTSLPEADCALGWQMDAGLVLYWKSRLEIDYERVPWRKVTISPFVSGFSYDCFDEATKQWLSTDTLRRDAKGNWPSVRRLRLHFSRDGREVEEIILVPPRAQGVPVS